MRYATVLLNNHTLFQEGKPDALELRAVYRRDKTLWSGEPRFDCVLLLYEHTQPGALLKILDSMKECHIGPPTQNNPSIIF